MSQYLSFDIGGTNCRMALFTMEADGRLVLSDVHRAPTRKVRTARDLYYAALCRLGQGITSCRGVAVAVAGPVVGDRAKLSNAELNLDRVELEHLFGVPVGLMNDFKAVCHAVVSPAGQNAEQLWGGEPVAGTRAVLGAGTGFGCAALVGDQCMSSEGGHMAFAFHGEEERAFEPYLLTRQKIAWASMDDVVSGRGLKSLAAYVTGLEYDGRECGRLFLRDGVDAPGDTVGRLFATWYARAARNWALATLCSGGLWIAGGIGIGNRAMLRSQVFRKEFVRGVHAGFLERVPVYLFRDDKYGLWGGAMAAVRLAAASEAART